MATKKPTLLEAARSASSRTSAPDITAEHIALALAYLKGDITQAQAHKALKVSPMSAYSLITRALKVAWEKGRLTEKK